MILAGKNAPQEALFLLMIGVRQQGYSGKHTNAAVGRTNRTDARQFIVHYRAKLWLEIAAKVIAWPIWCAPAGIGQKLSPLNQV